MNTLFAFAVLALLSLCTTCNSAPLNVHFVCHTHDDVGWLKTIDQYYVGSNNSIQFGAVQYIIDSVVTGLAVNPNRKFIYVEVAFFERWWNQQNDIMKEMARKVIKNGQLEFINGGYCMNDEATSTYTDIIDQMTRGHLFLAREFDIKPRIGWHIDPFGHSSIQAALFSLMGFDAFVVNRIDFQDFESRLLDKRMEFVWRGSKNFGSNADLFGYVTYHHYSAPPGFNFDIFSQDEPLQSDLMVADSNIEQRAAELAKFLDQQARYYGTNNILLTMGDDFQYSNANTWFKNLEQLINYYSSHPAYSSRYNLMYSTPSLYLEKVHSSPLNLSIKTDDFFPYRTDFHTPWVGYFTSRPTLKGYSRQMSNYLQMCRNMELFGKPVAREAGVRPAIMPAPLPNYYVDSSLFRSSQLLWDALSLVQHHDAIAGTEKQHVAYDYARRLAIGEDDCSVLSNINMRALTRNTETAPVFTFVQCPQLNVSLCPATVQATAGTVLAVVVWNNQAHPRSEVIRVPVFTDRVSVLDAQGASIPSQLLSNTDGTSKYVLAFTVEVGVVGYSTYFINYLSSKVEDKDALAEFGIIKPLPLGHMHMPYYENMHILRHSRVSAAPAIDPFIENSFLRVSFSASTGRMNAIVNKQTGQTVAIDQALLQYRSSYGSPQGHPSGAYTFRPNEQIAYPLTMTGQARLTLETGSLVQQAHQVFGPYASQTVRLFAGSPFIEVEYTIGPIDISDGWGHEVVTRWNTSLDCHKYFYTDENGRDMMKREINARPSYKSDIAEPVADNYYPINTATFLRDEAHQTQFTILVDRAEGAGSVSNGEIEVMLHRRILHDDGFGVGEPLNEPGLDGHGLIARVKHYILLGSPAQSSVWMHTYADHINYPTIPFFSATPSVAKWQESHKMSWSALPTGLPSNIRLLHLQPWAPNQILLRLEHMYELNEHPEFSKPTNVSLSNIFFKPFQVKSFSLLALSANQAEAERQPLAWNTQEDTATPQRRVTESNDATVLLNPFEIKTILLQE